MKNNPALTIINSNIQFHENIQTYHMTNFSFFFFLRVIGMVCETDMEKKRVPYILKYHHKIHGRSDFSEHRVPLANHYFPS